MRKRLASLSAQWSQSLSGHHALLTKYLQFAVVKHIGDGDSEPGAVMGACWQSKGQIAVNGLVVDYFQFQVTALSGEVCNFRAHCHKSPRLLVAGGQHALKAVVCVMNPTGILRHFLPHVCVDRIARSPEELSRHSTLDDFVLHGGLAREVGDRVDF